MTNHAARLRHMAEGWRQTAESTEKYGLPREKEADIAHYRAQAAALLAGAEALEQERGKVQWMKAAGSDSRQMALYRGWILEVEEGEVVWGWSADSARGRYGYQGPTLQAAQAAAIAEVDEQEGRNV